MAEPRELVLPNGCRASNSCYCEVRQVRDLPRGVVGDTRCVAARRRERESVGTAVSLSRGIGTEARVRRRCRGATWSARDLETVDVRKAGQGLSKTLPGICSVDLAMKASRASASR